jgi:hypothetical protein
MPYRGLYQKPPKGLYQSGDHQPERPVAAV